MPSAMFSHEPPTGVYSGMTPCSKSQQTNSGVLCPARLSSTGSTLGGGNSSGRVGLMVRPSCHISQSPLGAEPAAAGIVASTAASSRFSQPCRAGFGQVVTPSTRTWPSAGWDRVTTLAVPSRRYSCGWRAGSPSGLQDWPGYGTVRDGPAWSVHQTARPIASPVR